MIDDVSDISALRAISLSSGTRALLIFERRASRKMALHCSPPFTMLISFLRFKIDFSQAFGK